MNMAIEVKSETAQKLLLMAKSEGVSVDDLLRVYIPGLTLETKSHVLSPIEHAKAIEEWAANHRRDIPPLSDEAVSRKSFYE